MEPDVPLVVSQVNPDDLEGHEGIIANPELLDDAARAAADGAARHGRARAGRRRHLPVRLRHRRRGDRRAGGPDPRPRGGRAQAGQRSTRTRSRSTRCPRSTSSSTTATRRRSGRSSPRAARSCTCRTCASRARPSACPSSSATPRPSTSRPASRSRPSGRASCSRAVPGVVVQDDPAAHVYPLATEAAGRDEIFVGRVRQDPSIPDGRGLALLGRLGQPAQGRGDERRRDRRGARRAWLGPRPRSRREPPVRGARA